MFTYFKCMDKQYATLVLLLSSPSSNPNVLVSEWQWTGRIRDGDRSLIKEPELKATGGISFEDAPLGGFMCHGVTRMPGESYRGRFKSLLCPCESMDRFWWPPLPWILHYRSRARSVSENTKGQSQVLTVTAVTFRSERFVPPLPSPQ